MKSIHALILIIAAWLCIGIFFYPKWDKQYSEAAISWDVAGYYHYLPAIFIYKDLKQQKWLEGINEVYLPSPAYDQAYLHPRSGNRINKRTIGQAILYGPFFLGAHAYTLITDTYPADGYSKPYQVAIWFGGFLFSCLGLLLLRKILLRYFEDKIVGMTLIAIALATHWLEYATISNGMNHTWLFTLLCALILASDRFYQKADWKSAIGLGLLGGLIALVRPTEMVMLVVPLLWGIRSIKERYHFLLKHWPKVASAGIIFSIVFFIQLIYWKYAAHDWLVKSYGEQQFDFLHPAFFRNLLGANVGWWLYTPVMFLTLFGWVTLYKNHKQIFWAVFVTSLVAIYITFSWPYWEMGGGLGQRNLIQVYPLLAFPLASVIAWFYKTSVGKWTWIAILLVNMYYNAWWTWQAHHTGYFAPGQMNRQYFLKVVGRLHLDRELYKWLDTNEYFHGTPQYQKLLWSEDFETDSLLCQVILADSTKTACLDQQAEKLGPFRIPVPEDCRYWIRLEAVFNVQSREWNASKNAQWIVEFYQGRKIVKKNLIKIQRLIPHDYVDTPLYFDVQIPDEPFDACTVTFDHKGSLTKLMIDNLKVSCIE